MKPNHEELTVDILVAGAGAAGLSAAVAASEGQARVLVLEKMKMPGGTAIGAEGMFAAESRHQLRKNISVTKNEVFRNIMEYSHWKANPRLVRAYVEKSADTLAWLEKMGVTFTDVRTAALGGAMTWHIFKGRGASVIKALKENLLRQGGEIRPSSCVKELLMESNGKIGGAIAGSESGPNLKIKSKAVVIATGGFANNKKMLAEYTDCGENAVAIGNNGKMGEGLKMAWAAGAAKAGAGVVQLRGPVMEGEKVDSALNAVTKQPYLWINLEGERFCDESIVTNWPHAGNALAAQPKQTLFLIIDTNTRKYLGRKGDRHRCWRFHAGRNKTWQH